jgi:hypothetical protein
MVEVVARPEAVVQPEAVAQAATAAQVAPQGSVTTALKPLTTRRNAMRASRVLARGRASSATRSRVRTSSVAP